MRRIVFRLTLAALFIVAACLCGSGCTITRNAPLISSEIQINDSANNNEVPLLP
jgi:hypothetical protein